MRRVVSQWLAAMASVALFNSPAVAGALFQFLYLSDQGGFHFRLTVTLEASGRTVTAASVHEMVGSTEIRSIPGVGGGISATGRGEALRVEMPAGPPIYFLVADRVGNRGWYGALLEDLPTRRLREDPQAVNVVCGCCWRKPASF